MSEVEVEVSYASSETAKYGIVELDGSAAGFGSALSSPGDRKNHSKVAASPKLNEVDADDGADDEEGDEEGAGAGCIVCCCLTKSSFWLDHQALISRQDQATSQAFSMCRTCLWSWRFTRVSSARTMSIFSMNRSSILPRSKGTQWQTA